MGPLGDPLAPPQPGEGVSRQQCRVSREAWVVASAVRSLHSRAKKTEARRPASVCQASCLRIDWLTDLSSGSLWPLSQLPAPRSRGGCRCSLGVRAATSLYHLPGSQPQGPPSSPAAPTCQVCGQRALLQRLPHPRGRGGAGSPSAHLSPRLPSSHVDCGPLVWTPGEARRRQVSRADVCRRAAEPWGISDLDSEQRVPTEHHHHRGGRH